MDRIQAGHLAQRWRRPDAVQSGDGFMITHWGNGVQATAQTFGWFTYQSAVDLLVMRVDNSLTDTP